MKIPLALQPYVEIFQALDGHGQLWSPEGQFLGRLSSKADYINSLINPQSEYGSPHSLISIHNPQSQYGGDSGAYSPFNPKCSNPPIVFYRYQPLFVLTTNFELATNGLKTVDPYLVLTIYEALSYSTAVSESKPSSKPSSKLMIRSWATHAQLQSKLMPLSGSAFGLPLICQPNSQVSA